MALNLKRVARLIRQGKPGRQLDSQGLYLVVASRSAASWQLRFQLHHRARWMGLGSARTFSLLEARERARVERQRLADKLDPIALRAAERSRQAVAKVLTFKEAAAEFIADHRGTWRSADHGRQWINSLAHYVYPVIGSLNVADIGTAQVLKVLEQPVAGGKFWLTRPVTASRVRSRIELVLNRAMARNDLKHDNPAAWDKLQHILPAPSKVARVAHHPSLPYEQLPPFLIDLRQHEGVAGKALEFLIHTAARTDEVVGAVWTEIDLDKKLWVIPAERMKGGREHKVPLSAPAVKLLQSLHTEDGNPYLFIGTRQQRLSSASMAQLLRRMGYKDANGKHITVHGMRSTFSTWVSEQTGYDEAVREFCLAHVVGDASARAYARTDMLDKRRQLMEAWSAYCVSVPVVKSANVTPIGKGR
jgi:integrase